MTRTDPTFSEQSRSPTSKRIIALPILCGSSSMWLDERCHLSPGSRPSVNDDCPAQPCPAPTAPSRFTASTPPPHVDLVPPPTAWRRCRCHRHPILGAHPLRRDTGVHVRNFPNVRHPTRWVGFNECPGHEKYCRWGSSVSPRRGVSDCWARLGIRPIRAVTTVVRLESDRRELPGQRF